MRIIDGRIARSARTPAEKRQYAYHEAAHAVVGAGYGIRVTEVDPVHGATAFESPGLLDGQARRRRVRATLAGPVMGSLRGEDPGAGSDGASALGDVMEAFGIDKVYVAPGIMLEESFKVRAILERPEIKAAIEHLAQALIARGRMTEEELSVYLDPIRGHLGEPL